MSIKLKCKDEKTKRGVISQKTKDILFRYQNGRCFYCGNKFSTHYNDKPFVNKQIDHVWPFSYSFNDDIDNLVLCCGFCNYAKSDSVFNTLEEIIIYVRKKVNQKGIILRGVFGCIRSKKIVAKVLLNEVSQQRILENTPDYQNLTDNEIEMRLEQIKSLKKILC